LASVKLKVCADKDCSNEFKQYNSLVKYCGPICANKNKKPVATSKPIYKIPKVSQKRKIENLKYSVLRTEFLGKKENQICFIDGCTKKATSIEHLQGRWGKNFLDTTTWAACCLEHNLELETNPELSKKYQYSKISGIKKSEL
jgi:hypothetical protein